MEKRIKEDILVGRLIKEVGLEKPSSEFSANIMKMLVAQNRVKIYKPLISRNSWIILGIAVAIILLLLFFASLNLTPIFDINWMSEISFPAIYLSKTTVYAFCSLILFLFQIPFLKHLWEDNTDCENKLQK